MSVDERVGLTRAEVAERAANREPGRSSRSLLEILRANVLTRFNALIGSLCVLVLVFGSPIDALFGFVIVINSAVGVVQELRAKRTLDRLELASRSPVRVRRGGQAVSVAPQALVVDDVLLLGTGERVPVDGVVVATAGLEVDESFLTGESDAVVKDVGAELLSGSFVVAGGAELRATRVGPDAYAARLTAEASRFSLATSELYQGINRLLRYLTWLIVPIGALLVIRQFTGGEAIPDAVVGSVAGVVPMIPEGLVLMTSVAFAAGVIRLARRRCLVQELPAVEVLARVDTLCLDKTGTLTEPGLVLRELRAHGDEGLARSALAALAALDPSPNPTLRAVAAALGPAPGWAAAQVEPFSSARKYAAATFAGTGRWCLGAPDILLPAGDPDRAEAERLAGTGLRVLALTRADPGGAPRAAALVVLEQRLRPEAVPALRYFADQSVAVKVISGDHPASVGAIAGRLGVIGAAAAVDARQLPSTEDELATELEEHSVFGRVTPQQKRAFVRALRSRGHVVAMTGDGVNDALALKEADLGVAMGTGSTATRAVAKVVLLDDDFATLPHVVAEGRRVLANIERVANLFLTKTMYSLALAVLVGLAHLPFPFLPRHVTLVAALTIGIPGAFLALAPSNERARSGFVPRVLRFAAPAGVACAVATFAAYALARADGASSLEEDRSTATLTLFLVAFWVLVLVARPLNAWRLALVAAMAAGYALVALVPWTSEVFQLTYADLGNNAIALGCAAAGAAGLTAVTRWTARTWGGQRQ